jgi:hypothetical protein
MHQYAKSQLEFQNTTNGHANSQKNVSIEYQRSLAVDRGIQSGAFLRQFIHGRRRRQCAFRFFVPFLKALSAFTSLITRHYLLLRRAQLTKLLRRFLQEFAAAAKLRLEFGSVCVDPQLEARRSVGWVAETYLFGTSDSRPALRRPRQAGAALLPWCPPLHQPRFVYALCIPSWDNQRSQMFRSGERQQCPQTDRHTVFIYMIKNFRHRAHLAAELFSDDFSAPACFPKDKRDCFF